jgi:hypothetical protein
MRLRTLDQRVAKSRPCARLDDIARCSGRENVLWHSQAIFRRRFTDGDIEPELARVRVAPFVSA